MLRPIWSVCKMSKTPHRLKGYISACRKGARADRVVVGAEPSSSAPATAPIEVPADKSTPALTPSHAEARVVQLDRCRPFSRRHARAPARTCPRAREFGRLRRRNDLDQVLCDAGRRVSDVVDTSQVCPWLAATIARVRVRELVVFRFAASRVCSREQQRLLFHIVHRFKFRVAVNHDESYSRTGLLIRPEVRGSNDVGLPVVLTPIV